MKERKAEGAAPEETREVKRDAAEGERKALLALRENPVFLDLLREIGARAKVATDAHEDERRTPGQRAEWLHAMKELRALTRWADQKARRIAVILRRPV